MLFQRSSLASHTHQHCTHSIVSNYHWFLSPKKSHWRAFKALWWISDGHGPNIFASEKKKTDLVNVALVRVISVLCLGQSINRWQTSSSSWLHEHVKDEAHWTLNKKCFVWTVPSRSRCMEMKFMCVISSATCHTSWHRQHKREPPTSATSPWQPTSEQCS